MIKILKDTDDRDRDCCVLSICRCFCGKEFKTRRKDVLSGRIKSCGCSRIKNLVGKRFGKITVLHMTSAKSKYNGSVIWKCVCECGNEIELSTGQLKHPNRKSCGCDKSGIIAACKRKSGKNHHWYNHNLKDEDRINRPKQYEFTKSVYERDNYTCSCCNRRGGDLVAHHLDGYHWCKEKREDLDNGVTLCEGCHSDFHRLYGYKNNTRQQFIEYKENRYGKMPL